MCVSTSIVDCLYLSCTDFLCIMKTKLIFLKEKWTKWDSYLVSIMKCIDDMQAYVLQREGWTNWTDYFGCLDVCAIAMGMKMKWTKRVFK